MKLFFFWLKTKRKVLLIFFIFACIFAVSFRLYRLPVEAVLYPAVLCAICGAGFLVHDFLHFRERHRSYEDIKLLTAAMLNRLPEPQTAEEKDLQEIVASLREQNMNAENDFLNRYRDMTEYYSVWAHQIKTPIASMKLTLQNEDSDLSRKLTSDLSRIEQYVEMVLAFLRLDSASTDYVFRKYDIDRLVKQSVKKFAPDFICKKLRLEYDIPSFGIVTDEKWFSFVIEQLLSNAVKYTGEAAACGYI